MIEGKKALTGSMAEDLQAVIQRVMAGSRDEADLKEIADAVASERLVLANAPGAVGIGGDVIASQVVPGAENVIGDGNIVFQINTVTAQALQEIPELNAVLSQHFGSRKSGVNTPIDELVQQGRAYSCERIRELYSRVRLLNKRQINVSQLYVDVYILEQISAATHSSIPLLLKLFDSKQNRLALGIPKKRSPGFDVASKHSKLLILGTPGSGKTTFLQHLAIACCEGRFQPTRIPVLVRLRFFSNPRQFDLIKIINEELGTNDRRGMKQILTNGNILLLLDGLDEVSEQGRQTIQNRIQQFAKQYHKNWIILTCRTQVAEYVPDGFECIEIADFNLAQVEQFAYNWFSSLAETEGEILSQKFINELKQLKNQQIAGLAVTPILLSLLCWVFQDLQDFPANRVDLYQHGVELLLRKWDDSRNIERKFKSSIYQNLSLESKQDLLEHIAVKKFKEEQFILFEESEIQTYISDFLKISRQESLSVLKSIEIQHGLLIERASKLYSFSHLTFQEYFAARGLCDVKNWESVADGITEKRWLEILSIAFTRHNAESFAQTMKDQIDYYVKNETKIQELLTWLNNITQEHNIQNNSTNARNFYFLIVLSYIRKNKHSRKYNSAHGNNLLFSSRTVNDDFNLSEAVENLDSALTNSLHNLHDLAPDNSSDLASKLRLARKLSFVCHRLEDIQPIVFSCSLILLFFCLPLMPVNTTLIVTTRILNIENSLVFILPSILFFITFLSYLLPRILRKYVDKVSIRVCSRVSSILESINTVLNLTNEINRSLNIYDHEIVNLWMYDFNVQLNTIKNVFEQDISSFWQQWCQTEIRCILLEHLQQLRAGYYTVLNNVTNWKFNDTQKQILKNYHDANKLLVDCLKQSKIDLKVRQDIEEALLLPITEIEKRKDQKVRRVKRE